MDMIELLGERTSVRYVSKYAVSACAQALVDAGDAGKVIGSFDGNAAGRTAQIADPRFTGEFCVADFVADLQ